jgi:eukaryotic-like serine/threonine-protein kinase
MTGALDEGTRLGADGRYVLQSRLGSGGAATVWLAEDTVLERPVAVKILSEALSSDQSWLARFRREARLAASLQHPNLVSVYDFSADTDRPYLVMAHMPGGSLYDHLQAGERPDPERLTRDVLAALGAIHAAGIIHRDIKPGNILLAADGTACLTDFGVARPEDATSLTQTGHIPGTARYMAPELWQGHAADERSDLYATGVLLRGAVGDDAPDRVHDLIDDLAAEDRDERPTTATHALAELEAEERAPIAAASAPRRPEEPTMRTIEIRSEEHPHRRTAIAALALLGVVAAIAIAQAIGGGDEGSSPQNNRSAGNANADSSDGGGNSEPSNRSDPPVDEPVDSGLTAAEAAALNDEGKALLDAGDPEGAIPLLEQAEGFYPEDDRSVPHAFALYNLADALILAGRPDEAIPLLEERLEYNNQTSVVQARLDEARVAAGEGTASEAGPTGSEKVPPGQAKKKEKSDD